ncbi:AraC family transcriptional regulator [Paenibacillus sp. HB172176]|uniref:helix-turn-helix domain-containing protein n=1 Tax=Paenibacillus sp. HB172176 TaxID=2493690 RepID=UPI001439C641|nr:AraC family transcriptional regulator [Paenibacillus sp. HB172176]
MTEEHALPPLYHEADFEELWIKLRDVMRISEASENPKWRVSNEINSYLLIVVNREEWKFTVDNRLHLLKNGTIFVGVPGQRIAFIGDTAKGAGDGYALFFEMQGRSFIKDALLHKIENRQTASVVPEASTADLLSLCEKAYFYWNHSSKKQRFHSQAAFQEIVYQALYPFEEALAQGVDEAFEQVRLYLDLHYHENLSMEQLADRAGVSPRHFRRAFKTKFGVSASDYVSDLRISHAKRLMAAAKQPVSKVAVQVGYKEESYFRRVFKNRMGISPASYLKNLQLKVAAYSYPNIGQLLPLGIIPFSAPIDQSWTDAYRRKYHTEVVYPLHHQHEFNRQTLAAAKPDRILAIDAFGSADFQKQLEEIAPALIIPWRTENWREHLRMTASFLHKTQEAEDWLAVYDSKADKVCVTWNRLIRNEKLQIIMIDRLYCYEWKAGGGEMARNIFPFEPARHLKTFMDPLFERINPENLQLSEADHMVMLLSEDHVSQLTWKELQRSEC